MRTLSTQCLSLRSLVALCALLVAACSSPESPGELYLERLAGALDQDLPQRSVAVAPLRRFPAPAELLIERPDKKLKLSDLKGVHRCRLGPLIAARNGSLGRVQTPSQRLLYDQALIAGLESCESDNEALSVVLLERKAELPIARFNALFGDAEWHDFATPPLIDPLTIAPLKIDPLTLEQTGDRALPSNTPILAAITILETALADGADSPSATNFENALGELRLHRALGIQRLHWRQQAQILEAATVMLNRARRDNPGCRSGQPTPAGRVRHNVFQQYYAAGFQGLLARQAQPDRGWLLKLRKLISRSTKGLSQYAQAQKVVEFHDQVFGDGPGHEFGRWSASLDAHTRAWQWQLRACGLMPGR